MTLWVLFFIVVCTVHRHTLCIGCTYAALCFSVLSIEFLHRKLPRDGRNRLKERNPRKGYTNGCKWMLRCIRGKFKKLLLFKKVLKKKKKYQKSQILSQLSHFTFKKIHKQKSRALHTITEKRRAGSQQTGWQFYVSSAPKILFSKTCLTATCLVCYFRHFDM